MADDKLKLFIEVPFCNEREAEIAYEVLQVDKEPPRSQVSKTLNLNKHILLVCFKADTAHQLRTGVNGFFDYLILLLNMGEHTPAPTPSRGVYGFALYLICTCGFGLYIMWAVVPDHVLHSMGITYYPQKYWAIAIPVYCMMGLAIFAFFIYPGLNFLLTPSLDNMKTVTDSHAIYKGIVSQNNFFNEDVNSEEKNVHGIPLAYDIHISQVCQNLYFKRD